MKSRKNKHLDYLLVRIKELENEIFQHIGTYKKVELQYELNMVLLKSELRNRYIRRYMLLIR